MDKKIEQILSELYQADPSLQEHDSVLRKLVMDLMVAKPNVQLDENFKWELRRKLLNMETKIPLSKSLSLISNFMKRVQIVGASLAFIALIAVSLWYVNGLNGGNKNLSQVFSGPRITKAGDNAFGSLANVSEAGGRGQGGGGNASLAAEGSNTAPVPTSDTSVGSGGGSDAKMIAPYEPVNFNYVYTGEELTLVQDKVDVLKRIKGGDTGSISDFINSISMGLINMNSFSNTKVQNFSFIEDRELGYMVNVNPMEGTLSLNENWAKWQTTYSPCPLAERSSLIYPPGGGCNPQRIDISQVPSDEALISAANQFLQEHDIPTVAYGEPFVNKDWRVYYDNTPDKANYWIPETMSVVYPLIIDGSPVYDESGNPNGLSVSVRYTPQMKVSGVWELTTQNYQSSSYDAETSVERIMGLVAKGGFRNYFYSEPNARKVDVELGTPEVSYVKLWNYNPASGTSEELLVPALIFPVTKGPENTGSYFWYRKNVVIPLVKEILDNDNSGGVMPMVEDAVR